MKLSYHAGADLNARKLDGPATFPLDERRQHHIYGYTTALQIVT